MTTKTPHVQLKDALDRARARTNDSTLRVIREGGLCRVVQRTDRLTGLRPISETIKFLDQYKSPEAPETIIRGGDEPIGKYMALPEPNPETPCRIMLVVDCASDNVAELAKILMDEATSEGFVRLCMATGIPSVVTFK